MATLAEQIKQFFEDMLTVTDFTSASPQFTNKVKQFNPVSLPDFEATIRESTETEDIQRQNEIDDAVETVTSYKRGNVDEVARFSREQFGNVKGFATDPVGFIIQGVFGKFAKGAGVAALALVFFGVVQFIISEMLKPGRFLDRRFRRDITNEILAFRSREEKQKLRQGRSNIIVTTIGGLRGGEGQRASSYRAYAGLMPQPIPNNYIQPNTGAQASGQDLSLAKGERRRFRR